ncbi:uncharacterized protein ARMOST_13512 [Armillaria ostoyae]|uniref:Uncharacterized protein n=1 Tax=Armillaria ostoyae TaxID=47428 RepID=A0A284RN07_ARMOS|nr:uncharacterized protein ARMOST_13512 [Armillaria ostoyae]
MAKTTTTHATPPAMATSFPLPWKEASVFAEANTEEAERGEDSWDWEGWLKIVSDSIRIIEPETSTVCGTLVVIDWTSRVVMGKDAWESTTLGKGTRKPAVVYPD